MRHLLTPQNDPRFAWAAYRALFPLWKPEELKPTPEALKEFSLFVQDAEEAPDALPEEERPLSLSAAKAVAAIWLGRLSGI